MQLFLVKGYLDVAATTLADAQALLAALDNPGTAANSATIARVTGKLETLVQSDSGEPLTISSIDSAAGTISGWITDPSVTVAVGLGDPEPGAANAYASTLGLSISGSARVGTLALNTTALANALRARACMGYGVPRPSSFTLQVRQSTAGVGETMALLTLTVRAGLLPSTPVDSTPGGYLPLLDAYAGYVRNLSGVTSLTGGGATTLDGQLAGTSAFPVGCIVMTSDGDTGREWKLKSGYIAATDLDNGLVQPANSDATLNPVHWKLL